MLIEALIGYFGVVCTVEQDNGSTDIWRANRYVVGCHKPHFRRPSSVSIVRLCRLSPLPPSVACFLFSVTSFVPPVHVMRLLCSSFHHQCRDQSGPIHVICPCACSNTSLYRRPAFSRPPGRFSRLTILMLCNISM